MLSRDDSERLPPDAEDAWSAAGAATLALGGFPTSAGSQPHTHAELSIEDRYRALIEQVPAIVFYAPMAGGLSKAYVSPQIETILGFEPQEWLENPILWFRQLHSGDKERWANEVAPLFFNGKPVKSTYRALARDGAVVWLRCEAKMVFYDDGEPSFIHGVAFDITEMKRAEAALEIAHSELEARVEERTRQLKSVNEELERARDAAQSASQAKSDFLATVSHEIRTPMNGIVGMIQVLLDTVLTSEQSDAALTIQQSADSLLAIINDILDFSKIESGHLELASTAFRLPDVVDGVIRLFGPRAASAGLRLSASPVPDLYVAGDPLRLRQVLINLVGNAIKFTERGSVTVSVAKIGQDCWRFSVEDTGIGIPAGKQAMIFQAFTQADGSISRRFGGTGLGLAISSRLIEAMAGRIWVESKPAAGSTFHFTVPLPSPAPVLRSPDEEFDSLTPHAFGASLRILLVEDNPVNQKVALAILVKRGHHVTTASNGREGLIAAAREAFDVVLMDVQMPVMNGWEAAAAIRARERQSGAHLPIIALTAHARPGDLQACQAAGMDGYVTKPFQVETLLRELDRVQKKFTVANQG